MKLKFYEYSCDLRKRERPHSPLKGVKGNALLLISPDWSTDKICYFGMMCIKHHYGKSVSQASDLRNINRPSAIVLE